MILIADVRPLLRKGNVWGESWGGGRPFYGNVEDGSFCTSAYVINPSGKIYNSKFYSRKWRIGRTMTERFRPKRSFIVRSIQSYRVLFLPFPMPTLSIKASSRPFRSSTDSNVSCRTSWQTIPSLVSLPTPLHTPYTASYSPAALPLLLLLGPSTSSSSSTTADPNPHPSNSRSNLAAALM